MAVGDVLVGGFLAIAASVATTALQARHQSRARSEERDERRREIRRDQAEQVFEEVSKLIAGYIAQPLFVMRQIVNEAANLTIPDASEAPTTPSITRLEGLVSIYFPECLPIVDRFNSDAAAAVAVATKSIKEHVQAHQNDAPEPNFIKMIHFEMAKALAERAGTFSKQLREAMQSEIAKLW